MATRVRPINPDNSEEVHLVADRMRSTLIEVLGEERGGDMYTMDWLVARVSYHLDPMQCVGAVLVAELETGAIVGHAILRVESDTDGTPTGLFSTIYVTPEHRQIGVARSLIQSGEAWISEHDLGTATTYTHPGNGRLKNLLLKLGYACTAVNEDFVRLHKALNLD